MYALHVLILSASNLFVLTGLAVPITAEDVQLERQSIPSSICIEKHNAYENLTAGGSQLSQWPLIQGISPIYNKRINVDTSLYIPTRNTTLENPQQAQVLSPRQGMIANYTLSTNFVHFPSNNFRNFISTPDMKHPEQYIKPEILHQGINVLTMVKSELIPSCLTAVEVEEYIQLRYQLKFDVGDYWLLLHSGTLSDNQLAALRYYDYLDQKANKQLVSIYNCSTYSFSREY